MRRMKPNNLTESRLDRKLRLPCDSAPGCHLRRADSIRLGPPLLRLDHARLEQVESIEEARDRSPVTHGCLRSGHALVHALGHLRHLRRAEVAGGMREHQVTAGAGWIKPG